MIDWKNFLSREGIDEDLFKQFKARAEELTVEVLRARSGQHAASASAAVNLVMDVIKRLNIQNVAAAALTLADIKELESAAGSAGVEFFGQLDMDKIEAADMGISEFDLGIADLGSLFQDASDLHTRLVSMLPPVHLALLPTSALVESFADALAVIEKACNGEIPPYLSFVTGPSKTADIERELTIGVHGPKKLIIVCIDRDQHHACE
jgi:L-lactate dehydrogenase complex protein LldG